MNWYALVSLFIPVACLAYGLGMVHCRYIISRWPERNGFMRLADHRAALSTLTMKGEK